MRRHFSGVGCGARGPGETSPMALGRRRGSARDHYRVPARSWLTAGRFKVCPRPGACRGPMDRNARRADGSTKRTAGKARPGAVRKTPRWRAERRHVPETARVLKEGCADRRAVPLASCGGLFPRAPWSEGNKKAPLEAGRRRACPGPRKKYGRWRMPVSYPSPERGRVRREAPGVELANNPPTRSLATLPASGEGLERALAV